MGMLATGALSKDLTSPASVPAFTDGLSLYIVSKDHHTHDKQSNFLRCCRP
jgi:hypothetical protein